MGLLQKLGVKSSDEAITLYIGDDITDEDAFKVRSVLSFGLCMLMLRGGKQPGGESVPWSKCPSDSV